jgi:hypothetical protein
MSNVRIPKTELRAQIDAAEAIKQSMTGLLRELEESAGNTTSGAWRHREPRRTEPPKPT